MKKMRIRSQRPRAAGPVEVFDWGPLHFHVDRAKALLTDAVKYRAELRWPAPDWVGPNIEINERHVEASDLTRPVIFATVVLDGRPWSVLIDGNHRVIKALRQRAAVPVVTLDLADTLKLVRGPAGMIEEMRRDGRRLGLLSAAR